MTFVINLCTINLMSWDTLCTCDLCDIIIYVLMKLWDMYEIFLLHMLYNAKWDVSVKCTFFFLNNQPDEPVIQIYCYKTLHVSGIFAAHHQEFCTVHSALVSFMQVFDDRFQADSGRNCSSILTLLGSGHQKPAWNLPVQSVQ